MLLALIAGLSYSEVPAEPGGWLAQKACQLEVSRSSGPSGSCSTLEELLKRARTVLSSASTPQERIDRLSNFFFKDQGFRVTADLSSADHLLPSAVVAGKKGYCVGLALVYLAIAEDENFPIYGVATPKHVFVRWDDGKLRRNIELFQQGRAVANEDYVREQKIPEESIKKGVFMANLTSKEFLGFVYQNLGVLESQAEHFDASRKLYEHSLKLNPKLAAAHYNLGNDFLNQKQYTKAIHEYDKALKLYPGDPWALQNRGLAKKQIGEP